MQVFVTARAEKNFSSIVDYIKNKWGAPTAHEFIKKVDDMLVLLKKYPLIGQKESENIRGFQITPQTRVLYRIKNDRIIIVSFFDVRQHPDKK